MFRKKILYKILIINEPAYSAYQTSYFNSVESPRYKCLI